MNIVWKGSPNFTAGRGGNPVTGVIIHWMVGNLASADATFQNRARNTSAHYGVENDVIHQYVAEHDTAYQAGNYSVNQLTIGIEHSAQPGRAPSDKTYEQSAQLIAAAAKKYGFQISPQTIRHHYEIVATQCSGDVNNGGVDEARILKRAQQFFGESSPQPPIIVVPAPAKVAGLATVTVNSVMVRSSPTRSAPLAGSKQLMRGQTFDFVEAVQGENFEGVSTWLKSTKGNYVWAGGTDYHTTPAVHVPEGGTAKVTRTANVRVGPSTGAALGGSRQLQPGQTFTFTALVHGQLVVQNGVSSDLWYHSSVGNYVWSGNCQKI